jgi:hypothetical protein
MLSNGHLYPNPFPVEQTWGSLLQRQAGVDQAKMWEHCSQYGGLYEKRPHFGLQHTCAEQFLWASPEFGIRLMDPVVSQA